MSRAASVLRAKSVGIHAGTDLAWDAGSAQARGEFGIGGDVSGGKLTIDFSKADGFIGKILSAVKSTPDFEFGFDWSVARGMRFRGSQRARNQSCPTHLALGPVAIETLTLSAGIKGDAFPIALSADVASRLGVLDIVVEEIGARRRRLASRAGGHGAIGPLD